MELTLTIQRYRKRTIYLYYYYLLYIIDFLFYTIPLSVLFCILFQLLVAVLYYIFLDYFVEKVVTICQGGVQLNLGGLNSLYIIFPVHFTMRKCDIQKL